MWGLGGLWVIGRAMGEEGIWTFALISKDFSSSFLKGKNASITHQEYEHKIKNL